ncbi:MAG: hypothetical protein JSU95_14200 [Betaproteobacteria bacterium]|nr:MAG: hypothetical protein JSU95_14200 [Betaproteobacteria bacterium]
MSRMRPMKNPIWRFEASKASQIVFGALVLLTVSFRLAAMASPTKDLQGIFQMTLIGSRIP